MRDFFRSRFFTVLVLIMMAMVIVPSVFGAMGLGGALKNALNTVLTPVQKLFGYVSSAVDGFTDYFTEFDRIVDENAMLRETNNRLQDKISAAEETEQMNEWLFTFLELKREHTDYKLQPATVTGRESGNYKKVYILDKGSAQGIEVNMPVITADGIIGHIVDVGTDWSKVVTVLESGVSVGAYVERSGEIGVVSGNFDLAGEGLCEMKYLSAESDVKEGDRIISSGYGSVYPRGLAVGYVESVEKDAASRSVTVKIRPSADLGDASRLMILTDYETYTE